ncbi:hypothetical protein QBC35DRAFT_495867 [Podospora australis]|uniref:Uncharacterized protein n=1 Tax=Podospora australis TaxID=1536484 RepID=A0AAN7AIK6_9PEZI|nr:hypothetical protein QBC35DRAFT_495867 [Podospora australis]
MDLSDGSFFPLQAVTNEDLASLCEAIWEWTPCQQWISGESCQTPGCSCQRAIKLQPFFDYYKDVTAHYLPDHVGQSDPALGSHSHLISIISLLKTHPEKSRLELTVRYFEERLKKEGNESSGPAQSDRDRALNIGARITVMTPPSAQGHWDGLLETGTRPLVWHGDRSLHDFVNTAFPKKIHPALDIDIETASSAKIDIHSITAERAKRVARLKLIPTDDLRDHLLLDEKAGTLSIFHYTSVLKEHLLAAERQYHHDQNQPHGQQQRSPPSHKLKQSPLLPHQLALETLLTLKEILFPDDRESQSILRTLVSKKQFDPDLIRIVDTPSYLSAVSAPYQYQYWGSRLMDLHEELENPTPRGFFATWLERKSGARYVMMATLAGVGIAVLLGILGLAVGIFQAWVAWQQWKHPVISD